MNKKLIAIAAVVVLVVGALVAWQVIKSNQEAEEKLSLACQGMAEDNDKTMTSVAESALFLNKMYESNKPLPASLTRGGQPIPLSEMSEDQRTEFFNWKAEPGGFGTSVDFVLSDIEGGEVSRIFDNTRSACTKGAEGKQECEQIGASAPGDVAREFEAALHKEDPFRENKHLPGVGKAPEKRAVQYVQTEIEKLDVGAVCAEAAGS